MKHHTKWGSLAGLTVKRDDVTGLAPAGDLVLIDKSSFLFDSLLLMLGPEGKKTKYIKHYANVISPIGAFFHFNISTTQLKVETVLIVFLKSIVKY